MKYLVLGSLFLAAACAHLSGQDRLDLAEYEGRQDACIAAGGGKAAIDACRDAVKADIRGRLNQRFDGGF